MWEENVRILFLSFFGNGEEKCVFCVFNQSSVLEFARKEETYRCLSKSNNILQQGQDLLPSLHR